MENLNETILEGNLTRDCGANERDFIYTQGGSAVATISIAVNSAKKLSDGTYGTEVSYFDVKIYGKTAENLKPYLKKGQCVLVVGTLKQDRWEKDGKKFDKVYINSNKVQLRGGKKEEAPQSSYAKEYQQQQNADGFVEDIPF